MDSVEQVFDRYETVRHRLPHAVFPDDTKEIGSLLDVVSQADAFVFDAFGVLNIGKTPIDGAAVRLDQLRSEGCAIRILSNAASYDHQKAVEKFQKLGIVIADQEVITSRDATLECLNSELWGCIAATDDDLSDIDAKVVRLGDDRALYNTVDAFLFLSTEDWSLERQTILEGALRQRVRPIWIANADVVAPREHGFTLEPGHFGHLLADKGLEHVRFFGKPFPEAYRMVEASLPNIPRERIVMCGDTLHTDILGAVARGWRTVLVTKDGVFSGTNALDYCRLSNCKPDWHLERI